MPVMLYIILYLILFIAGSCVFSFLNVLIYRVPLELDFVKGRSFCPKCKHTLSAKDLFPVLSYTLLKGRCRYCGEKISFRYTGIELLGGLSLCFCCYYFGLSISAVTAFLFLCVMCVISFVDADTMEIPNGFVIAAAAVAALSYFFPAVDAGGLVSRLIGMAVVSVPMFVLALVIEGAFGGGDIKLMLVTGFFFGWKLTLLSMFLGLVFGSIFAVYLMATKKKKRNELFAFGPFLCGGMSAALFFGEKILSFYLSFFNI